MTDKQRNAMKAFMVVVVASSLLGVCEDIRHPGLIGLNMACRERALPGAL